MWIVVDNFLSPIALEALHTVALESTIFYDARATYLGACVAPIEHTVARQLSNAELLMIRCFVYCTDIFTMGLVGLFKACYHS